MVVRFDDITIATYDKNVVEITDFLLSKGIEVWYGICPNYFSTAEKGFAFPRILSAMSDHRVFYKCDHCGIPLVSQWIKKISHGLVHVDHRLLDWQAQELSIVLSCSLIKTNYFCPPFNKYNQDTVDICKKNGIELIRFEDGWRCIDYTKYTHGYKLWYLHAYKHTAASISRWAETEEA